MFPINRALARMSAIFVLLLMTIGAGDSMAGCASGDYETQRHQMVAQQIMGRGIHDAAVLSAMRAVPRHCFVPAKLQAQAYRDGPLPIGHDQTISQPYIVAKMSELLELKAGQRVLEVGTGSGYQAAILAQMGVSVYSIEILEPLGLQARKVLKTLAYPRIETRIGDGYKGWPQHAPFDGIIVTCAPSHIPEPLQVQLAEGGRMVIPVGESGGPQRLYLLRKVNGRIKQEKIFKVRFVPMVDEKGRDY